MHLSHIPYVTFRSRSACHASCNTVPGTLECFHDRARVTRGWTWYKQPRASAAIPVPERIHSSWNNCGEVDSCNAPVKRSTTVWRGAAQWRCSPHQLLSCRYTCGTPLAAQIARLAHSKHGVLCKCLGKTTLIGYPSTALLSRRTRPGQEHLREGMGG
jgi:hypothetical protein